MYFQEDEVIWNQTGDWLCTPCHISALAATDNEGTPVQGTVTKAWYGTHDSLSEFPFSVAPDALECKVFPRSQKLGDSFITYERFPESH